MPIRVRALALLLVLLAGGGAVTACGTRTVEYQGDYPHYSTLEELYRKASLVVEAKVGTQSRVRLMYPDGKTGGDDFVVTTVRPVEVVRVHKGAAAAGQSVDVGQTGGEHQGVVYSQPGSAPLREGTTYLLFLEVFPDSPAVLLNPDQAQYPIDAAGMPSSLPGNQITVTLDELARLSSGV